MSLEIITNTSQSDYYLWLQEDAKPVIPSTQLLFPNHLCDTVQTNTKVEICC